MQVSIKVKKLRKDAKLPYYATDGAAGMDLTAPASYSLISDFLIDIPLGIAVEIPVGYEGQIRPRSGLSKEGIVLVNSPSTIDSDYRGELRVLLKNTPENGVCRAHKIKKGDRIAQLVVTPVVKCSVREVTELSDTVRGEGRFGSTGR
ncbi:MAG: dUTP diphosphatase [Candidatus Hodarchaeales archaeon]|jgi:dUTP pyrophosphatase